MEVNTITQSKRIAILTGGGDTPALNSSIKAIRDRAVVLGYDVLGIRRGWKGLTGDGEMIDITSASIDATYGGTVLRSSRTNPFAPGNETRKMEVLQNLKAYKIDVLVVIGGDDTIGAARTLYLEEKIPVIAFPKTIDNDLRTMSFSTSEKNQEVVLCPGFPTAADTVIDYTNKLKTYAQSHERVLVIEVMGRNAGWLAGAAAMAGADFVLVPEVVMDEARKADFIRQVKKAYEKAEQGYVVVAVAEGVQWYDDSKGVADYVHASSELDDFGHPAFGGVCGVVARDIKKATGYPAKGVISGFYARSGSCGAYDIKLTQVLADRLQQMLREESFGRMPVVDVVTADAHLVMENTRSIDLEHVGNFPLPESYYDLSAYNISTTYRTMLNDVVSLKNQESFDIPIVAVKK